MRFYNSRYNFCFPISEGVVIYNASKGSCSVLNGKDTLILGELLCNEKLFFEDSFFHESTFDLFIKNGFLIEEFRSELKELKEVFWTARGETPVVLTITTTMDCNLGCYYCYESRSKQKLQFSEIPEIIANLDRIFLNSSKKSLHLDWYGGEPMLNSDFLEEASIAIQKFCSQRGINYHSSIISNGTLWPQDLGDFILRHKIRQVQISFDGLKEIHNKKRRIRKEFLENEDNSFDIIVELVDKLLDFVQVDLRLNIDWQNKDEVEDFIDFIKAREWFSKKYPAIFQPARIANYSIKSSFLDSKQLSINEFDLIRKKASEKLRNTAKVEESEVPDGYPFPKNYVCAALANDSFVLGSDKLIYRCGLQVGEKHRAVGSINNKPEDKTKFADSDWWNSFDPSNLPNCSKCSFLPVCMGGCPKKHLENDQKALDEQSLYWLNNLADKVLKYNGIEVTNKIVLTKKDQFKNGYDEIVIN